jgi:hypothetical protein
VPILAKLRISGPLLTPYIIAGPRIDYYLSGGGENLLVNDFKKINIGGTFDVGVESASILPIQMGLEFRYSPDFQDSYSDLGKTIKNRSMEFLLVLGF